MNTPSISAPILVVTDDPALADTLGKVLEDERLHQSLARDAPSIEQEVEQTQPRAILLDSRYLGETTQMACRRLRKNKATSLSPIIVITSPENVTARVQALENGADDCITAPGDPRELAARIRSRVRNDLPRARGRLQAGPIELDLDRWTAQVSGQPVALTKKEFILLEALIESRGRTLSREYLLKNVWSLNATVETRTIDVHIARLRRKLGPAGRYILTIRNVGFRLDLMPDWITGRTATDKN